MATEEKGGAKSDTDSEASFDNEELAKEFFETVKERLLDVNNWHKRAGQATAKFTLTDNSGVEVQRSVQEGDHFKIDIPGPGTATGDGYDWVRVESINDDATSLSITVRPATNPTNDKKDIAHFFSDEATSCFEVKREGNKVIAAVHGRNEKPNTGAEKTTDKARNAAVASGAIGGFSKLQWKSLVNGLVEKD